MIIFFLSIFTSVSDHPISSLTFIMFAGQDIVYFFTNLNTIWKLSKVQLTTKQQVATKTSINTQKKVTHKKNDTNDGNSVQVKKEINFYLIPVANHYAPIKQFWESSEFTNPY